MSPHDLFESYRRMRGSLPFDVDDTAAAANAFARWQDGDDAARETVALWAYLFLTRAFAQRFLRETKRPSSDLDALLTETYSRVMARADQVREAVRFPAWVSIVAQNTFRTYLRRVPVTDALPLDYDAADEDAPQPFDADTLSDLRLHLADAVNRLPDYLRDVARRRMVDHADYDAIANETGKTVQVVRSYAKKALDRLREDPALRVLVGLD